MKTLDPSRTDATPIAALGTRLVVREGLARVLGAIERHFPENLFADLDALAAVLEPLADRAVLARADRIVEVHRAFGGETALRFQYTHDFLYGFDWARWVARDPAERAFVGPYDDVFLDYSEQRAAELVALVSTNDQKYGSLDPGTHRNPFPFRRDPSSEHTLHRALAADGAIPVRAWSASLPPVWDRPFTALREEKAKELGLALVP